MTKLMEWSDKELAEEYFNLSKHLDAASRDDYEGSYGVDDELNKVKIQAHLLYRGIIVCQECGEYWKPTDEEQFECPGCGTMDFIERSEYDSLRKEAIETLAKAYGVKK